MTFSIKRAVSRDDFEIVAALAASLAAFHGEAAAPHPERLFQDRSWFWADLLFCDGEGAGFSGCYRTYSCHTAERGIEVQNLFVSERYRRQEAGFALIRSAVVDALRNECSYVKIGVRKTNVTGLRFYRRLGSAISDKGDSWRCKLDAPAMARIAEAASPADCESGSSSSEI